MTWEIKGWRYSQVVTHSVEWTYWLATSILIRLLITRGLERKEFLNEYNKRVGKKPQ